MAISPFADLTFILKSSIFFICNCLKLMAKQGKVHFDKMTNFVKEKVFVW